jgi:hypothetical protein
VFTSYPKGISIFRIQFLIFPIFYLLLLSAILVHLCSAYCLNIQSVLCTIISGKVIFDSSSENICFNFFFVLQQPNLALGDLILGESRSHTHMHKKTNIHALSRIGNRKSQQSRDRRNTPLTARQLGSACIICNLDSEEYSLWAWGLSLLYVLFSSLKTQTVFAA